MVKPIRRVVTGHDHRGRAVVISDGPAPSVHINKAEQDWFSVDIWRTHDMPAKIVPKQRRSLRRALVVRCRPRMALSCASTAFRQNPRPYG